jgi:hypothetical protein
MRIGNRLVFTLIIKLLEWFILSFQLNPDVNHTHKQVGANKTDLKRFSE